VTSTPAFRRFAFAFAASFALIYAVARAPGLALFTVYPSLDIVLPGMRRSRDVVDPAMEFLAPEIWWYGWTATATLGGLIIGLIAALLPDRLCRLYWSRCAWGVPVGAMIACVYLTLPWFRQ
jgi:hypothetical protein